MPREEREEELEKRELNRSYPELVRQIISRAAEVAEEEIRTLSAIKRKLADEEGRILERAVRLPEAEPFQRVSGVDGSFVTFSWFGGRKLVVYGVSAVIFRSLDSEPKVLVDAGVGLLDEEELPEAWVMLRESRFVLRACEASRGGLILLDGPIVDPPTLSEPGYVRERAMMIRRARETGCSVVGFIKRYRSRSLSRELLPTMTDWEVAPLVFEKLHSALGERVATYPIRSAEEVEPAPLYEDVIGEELFRAFVSYRGAAKPYKIEFMGRDGEVLDFVSRVVATFEALACPPTGIPLPVLLAHNTSLVRKRAARKIVRDALSRVVTAHPEASLMLEDVIGSEVE